MAPDSTSFRVIAGITASFAAIGVAVALMLPLGESVNATTVAIALMLIVVLISRFFESVSGVVASFIAAVSLNYFFLPPYRTLVVSDPENWVALFVFLAIAATVGHLSAVSNRRRTEAERLYSELEASFESASEAEALRRSEQ